MVPYRLMYRLGFAPWERRDVPELWRPLFEGPDAMEPARALDIGCGSGRDAVHLAGHGWQVSAVEFVDKALARAKQRAAEEGVEVQWVRGDVGELGRLGLEPGYRLLYDFGCIQGLSDSARRGAAASRVGRHRGHAPAGPPCRADPVSTGQTHRTLGVIQRRLQGRLQRARRGRNQP